MIARRASVGLSIVLLVALAGCTVPREPPPGVTAEETAALLETRIDQAWMNTGLDGLVERPEVDRGTVAADFNELAECLVDTGLTDWGMSDGSTGPGLAAAEAPTPDDQLIFYTCFAQHPTDVVMGGIRLSREQLDYLYDYYRSWVIPCLALDSITVSSVPTRSEFGRDFWQGWNPYDQAPALVTDADYNEAIGRCGPVYADLDVIDPFGRGAVDFGATTTSVTTIDIYDTGA